MRDKSKKIKDKKIQRGFLSFIFCPLSSQQGFTPPLQDFQKGQQNSTQAGDSSGMSRRISARAGFTLLETVVALTVILAAVVGPVSLITRGLFSFSFSKNKVVAANLAQEGLEIIRLIRENNIACDALNGPAVWPWNQDPDGSPPTQQNPDGTPMRRLKVSADMQSQTTISCGSATLSMSRLSLSCSSSLLFESDPFLPNFGTYGHTSGKPTIFSRCVEITSPPDDPDSDIPPSDQMDVASTVTWSDHGSDKSMKLRERLYNWR